MPAWKPMWRPPASGRKFIIIIHITVSCVKLYAISIYCWCYYSIMMDIKRMLRNSKEIRRAGGISCCIFRRIGWSAYVILEPEVVTSHTITTRQTNSASLMGGCKRLEILVGLSWCYSTCYYTNSTWFRIAPFNITKHSITEEHIFVRTLHEHAPHGQPQYRRLFLYLGVFYVIYALLPPANVSISMSTCWRQLVHWRPRGHLTCLMTWWRLMLIVRALLSPLHGTPSY